MPKLETIILAKGRLSITKVALQRHGTTGRPDCARIAESEKLIQRRAIALLKAADPIIDLSRESTERAKWEFD